MSRALPEVEGAKGYVKGLRKLLNEGLEFESGKKHKGDLVSHSGEVVASGPRENP